MGVLLSGADVIDLAVQTEVRGERFYREAAEAADRAEAKELFAYLAKEEVRHRRLFESLNVSIISTEMDTTAWDEAAAYISATVDGAFFAKGDAPIRAVPQGATVSQMLRQAIEFEKQTLLYFYALRDLVQSANRPLIDNVVNEEKSHVRRLAAMLSLQAAQPVA